MIHDVDATLRALIERDVLNGPGVELSFDAPTKEWAAKLALPTINVFLFDIREDPSRRDVFFEDVRDEDGRVVERRQPPRRMRLAYLLSAWTKRAEDEHRLLSALLGCFLQADVLPPDLLGRLLEQMSRLQRDVLAPRGFGPAGLSDREVEVLRHLADGCDTSEIAQTMAYSERTIKNIIHEVTRRLNLRNRSHAVAYAVKAGLI